MHALLASAGRHRMTRLDRLRYALISLGQASLRAQSEHLVKKHWVQEVVMMEEEKRRAAQQAAGRDGAGSKAAAAGTGGGGAGGGGAGGGGGGGQQRPPGRAEASVPAGGVKDVSHPFGPSLRKSFARMRSSATLLGSATAPGHLTLAGGGQIEGATARWCRRGEVPLPERRVARVLRTVYGTLMERQEKEVEEERAAKAKAGEACAKKRCVAHCVAWWRRCGCRCRRGGAGGEGGGPAITAAAVAPAAAKRGGGTQLVKPAPARASSSRSPLLSAAGLPAQGPPGPPAAGVVFVAAPAAGALQGASVALTARERWLTAAASLAASSKQARGERAQSQLVTGASDAADGLVALANTRLVDPYPQRAGLVSMADVVALMEDCLARRLLDPRTANHFQRANRLRFVAKEAAQQQDASIARQREAYYSGFGGGDKRRREFIGIMDRLVSQVRVDVRALRGRGRRAVDAGAGSEGWRDQKGGATPRSAQKRIQ
jgi:hypothetical protein